MPKLIQPELCTGCITCASCGLCQNACLRCFGGAGTGNPHPYGGDAAGTSCSRKSCRASGGCCE